jgi:hypothetical protein
MKKVVAVLLMTAGTVCAVGSMGALFDSTWSITAKMAAFKKECHGLPEPGQCRTLRAIIASDLDDLIKFCNALPGSSDARDTLKRATHDFDLIHTPKSDYDFQLKIAGGPQWSSGDLVEPKIP